MDLLPASLAALGAVIGLFVGATLGSALWWAVFSPDTSDIPPIVIGGLGGAIALAWVGLRISGRLTRRAAKPS